MNVSSHMFLNFRLRNISSDMFLSWPRNISSYVPRCYVTEEHKLCYVPRPRCPSSLMFIKIYFSVMFLGWSRNISYVPRPPTYVPRFLVEEHLSIFCSVV
jgi:hypothetical protein